MTSNKNTIIPGFVSCIIPVYNRAARVVDAVKSVLEQDYPEFELIVIDDGSTDATEEALLPFLDNPRFVYLRQPHSGVSAARNHGIRKSRGEWIALLDSDDRWLPGKLSAQIEFFRQNPGYRICQTEEIWIRHGRRVNPMKKHRKTGGWIFKRCLELCVVSPSAVMIHKSVLDQVGLFDESFPACEDYDLWLRIACRYPVGLLSEFYMVRYGGHADQLSSTVPTLDRYRIQAIEKILGSGVLSARQYTAAVEELKRKCFVYGNGCLKRGKQEEGARILAIPQKYCLS
jgi:glycosyltransferase involved in cell wall biosynthesis